MSMLISTKHKKNSKLSIILAILCLLILFGMLAFFFREHISSLFNKPSVSVYIANSENTEPTDVNTEINSDANTSTNAIEKNSEVTPDIPPATLSNEQYNNIIGIYRLNTEKTVYLTFDDGPSNNVTPCILDLLDAENIKATFFVLGTNVEKYPEIVKREYSGGHFIANHGYSHKYSEIYQNTDTILNDYLQCDNALKKVLDNNSFSSRVYRFPGGSSGRQISRNKSCWKRNSKAE